MSVFKKTANSIGHNSKGVDPGSKESHQLIERNFAPETASPPPLITFVQMLA